MDRETDERETIERASEPVEAIAWGLVVAIALAGVAAAIKGREGKSTALEAAVISAGIAGARARAVEGIERGTSAMVRSVADATDADFARGAFRSAGIAYNGWRESARLASVVSNARNVSAQAQAAVGIGEITVRHWRGGEMAVDAWVRSVMDASAQATAAGEHISRTTAQAVRAVMRDGGVAIGYHGKRYDITGFVRQRAWDGARIAMQGLRDEVGREIGWSSVQVSAHAFCAPDHLEYQGRVYSAIEFQKIQDGLPRQIGMWNCRHITTPCPDGTKSTYTAAERRMLERESLREVTLTGLDGKQHTMTKYEASQWQRGMERGIRGAKVEAQAMKMIGDSQAAQAARSRSRDLTEALRSGADEAGLRLDPRRVVVGRI